jgi:hypothetical protein
MKNLTLPSFGLAVLGILACSGCAHTSQEKDLDAKLSQTAPLDRAELGQEENHAISNTGLSDDQKNRLTDLRISTRKELDGLRDQSMRLRNLLVQDVLAKDDRTSEVKRIQDRMKDVESKRLTVMFSAVDSANLILGHEGAANERNTHYFEEFLGSKDIRN